jgi:Lrp/AsnC family leucine-responsive transcriptional regulator
MNRLDDADRRLLNLLQSDSRRTTAELAGAAGLSVPTCHRRLQALRASGTIQREVALVDPERSPLPVTVIVEVTLEEQSEDKKLAFETEMLASAQVQQCYLVAGQIDYLVVLQVKDIASCHEFVRATFTANRNVRRFNTMFVMKRNKFDMRIPF